MYRILIFYGTGDVFKGTLRPWSEMLDFLEVLDTTTDDRIFRDDKFVVYKEED